MCVYKQQEFISYSFGDWEAQVQGAAQFSFSLRQWMTVSVSLHGRERGNKVSGVSFCEGTNPIMRSLTSRSQFNLITSRGLHV